MTLDEAIEERQKIIEVQEKLYEKASTNESKEIIKSATDNDRQLAEWLTELKELREENKVLTSECDRLIKEKGELLSKVSGGDVLRICQLEEQLKDWKEEYANLNKISYGFYEELREAKRLLKVAVEDFSNIYDHIFDCDGMCNTCPIHGNRDTCDKWVHADEALKLLNDEK